MKSLVLRHGWTFVVLSATLTYFLALRSFGFQLEDEGTLLFQLGRAANGGLPYVDFHTGYTPGFFALGSWLIRSVGYSVEGIRTALALVNAASVVLLYLLARRAVGARLALVPAIAWLAAIPVDVGAFASFNVPYPAWPVALAWLVLALSLLVWAESGKTGPLVVAGLAAAAAFSLKPNAGAYAVAACVWTVSSLGRRHSRLDVVVARVASAAMALGVFSVFSQTLGLPRWGVDVVVHLGPVAAVAALWSARAAVRAGPGPGHGVFAALAVVGVAFTLPTLAWVVPVVMELGLNTFGSEVLLLGSRAAEIYYSSHPVAQGWAVAVVLGVLAVAVCGHFVRRGLLHPGRLAIAAGVIGSGGLLVLQATALAPQSLPASVSMQLENASFWLAPLSNWAGIAYLYFFGTRRGSQRTRRWLYVIVPVATAMYLQLYPRTDFMHLIFSVPLTAVLATVLLRRVAAWWTEGMGRHGRAIVGTAIAVAVVLAVALRLGPVLALAYAPVGGGATEIEAGRLKVWAGSGTSDDLQALAMVVDFLRGQTAEGSDVLHFPALGGVLFAAGLSSPLAHDYWYPGFPDHGQELLMVERLKKRPPSYVVTLNGGWNWFVGAPPYFLKLRDFVVDRYHLVARFGRYDILAKGRGPAVGGVHTWSPTGTMGAVVEPATAMRRQAVRRWMAALTVEEAHDVSMPAGEKARVLLLRALRDGADLRVLGWILAGLSDESGRVRHEAHGAAVRVVERFDADRHRWADDVDLQDYLKYVGPHIESVQALSGSKPETTRLLLPAIETIMTASRDR